MKVVVSDHYLNNLTVEECYLARIQRQVVHYDSRTRLVSFNAVCFIVNMGVGRTKRAEAEQRRHSGPYRSVY